MWTVSAPQNRLFPLCISMALGVGESAGLAVVPESVRRVGAVGL